MPPRMLRFRLRCRCWKQQLPPLAVLVAQVQMSRSRLCWCSWSVMPAAAPALPMSMRRTSHFQLLGCGHGGRSELALETLQVPEQARARASRLQWSQCTFTRRVRPRTRQREPRLLLLEPLPLSTTHQQRLVQAVGQQCAAAARRLAPALVQLVQEAVPLVQLVEGRCPTASQRLQSDRLWQRKRTRQRRCKLLRCLLCLAAALRRPLLLQR